MKEQEPRKIDDLTRQELSDLLKEMVDILADEELVNDEVVEQFLDILEYFECEEGGEAKWNWFAGYLNIIGQEKKGYNFVKGVLK